VALGSQSSMGTVAKEAMPVSLLPCEPTRATQKKKKKNTHTCTERTCACRHNTYARSCSAVQLHTSGKMTMLPYYTVQMLHVFTLLYMAIHVPAQRRQKS